MVIKAVKPGIRPAIRPAIKPAVAARHSTPHSGRWNRSNPTGAGQGVTNLLIRSWAVGYATARTRPAETIWAKIGQR